MRNELTAAYSAYVEGRQQVKQELRQELVERSEPLLIALGAAVVDALDSGMNMTEIARTLDVSNRNLLYDAKNAYRPRTDVMDAIISRTNTPATPSTDVAEASWSAERIGDTDWEVTIGDDTYMLVTDDDSGVLVVPDEWATASAEERALYKTILKELGGRA